MLLAICRDGESLEPHLVIATLPTWLEGELNWNQEEPIVQRTAEVGDHLGSAILAGDSFATACASPC